MQHYELDQIEQDRRETEYSEFLDNFVELATDEIMSGITQQLIKIELLNQYVREFAEAMKVNSETCIENFAFDFKQTHFLGV